MAHNSLPQKVLQKSRKFRARNEFGTIRERCRRSGGQRHLDSPAVRGDFLGKKRYGDWLEPCLCRNQVLSNYGNVSRRHTQDGCRCGQYHLP